MGNLFMIQGGTGEVERERERKQHHQNLTPQKTTTTTMHRTGIWNFQLNKRNQAANLLWIN